MNKKSLCNYVSTLQSEFQCIYVKLLCNLILLQNLLLHIHFDIYNMYHRMKYRVTQKVCDFGIFQSYFFHSQKHGSILTFIGYKQTDEESIFILSPPGGGGNIALTMYWNKTEIMFETIEKFHAHCLSYLCSLKLSQVIDKLFLSVESIHYTDQ